MREAMKPGDSCLIGRQRGVVLVAYVVNGKTTGYEIQVGRDVLTVGALDVTPTPPTEGSKP
jgi:hypothetical protein